MPVARRRYKKRTLAKRVSALEKAVERGYVDTTIAGGVSVSNTASIQVVSNIAQGDTVNDREGVRSTPVSLHIRLHASCHASATATMLKVVILQNSAAGTAPTSSYLYDSITNVQSFRNKDYTTQYRIIYSKILLLDNVSKKQFRLQFTIPKKKLREIKWTKSDTAGITYAAGAIFAYLISNEVTNAPTVYAYARLEYEDM